MVYHGGVNAPREAPRFVPACGVTSGVPRSKEDISRLSMTLCQTALLTEGVIPHGSSSSFSGQSHIGSPCISSNEM